MLELIRRMVVARELKEENDARLLSRFAAERDQGAFAEIVRRYGPMVFGVCSRVLQHAADAEDAFQATFLVLASKSASIGNPGKLSNWLYGVACRVAWKARTARFRSAVVRTDRAELNTNPVGSEMETSELRSVIDREIGRLPQRLRTAFVLCYLQGKTNEEAARLTGVPYGTVVSRLATARERLRTRLTQKGMAPAVGTLISLIACNGVSAALIERTAWLAVKPLSASTSVAALASGVIQTMFLIKLKMLVASTAAAVALGCGLLAYSMNDSAPGPIQSQAANGNFARADDNPKEKDPAVKVGPVEQKGVRPSPVTTNVEIKKETHTLGNYREMKYLVGTEAGGVEITAAADGKTLTAQSKSAAFRTESMPDGGKLVRLTLIAKNHVEYVDIDGDGLLDGMVNYTTAKTAISVDGKWVEVQSKGGEDFSDNRRRQTASEPAITYVFKGSAWVKEQDSK